jgi:chemotaxis protein MotB
LKKSQQQDEGSPAWMLTYGDLVTQMLAFFIMLFAASTIQQTRWSAMVGSLKATLGVMPHQLSATQPLRLPVPRAQRAARRGITGLAGDQVMVSKIEHGRKITIASKILFEEGKADLLPEARVPLLTVAGHLRGFLNRIEVRGHAGAGEIRPGGLYADAMDLSFARAKAVRGFLVSSGSLGEKRIRVVGCGSWEPAASDLYEAERWGNWRVEIIETAEMTLP